MALANVKPLKRPEPDDGALAAVPQPPSLSDRLAEAQQAAQAPVRRAAELDAALKAALARQDYAAAQSLKDELADARQEAAIATAAVTGLQTAIAEIERQRAEDNRVIAEQQQHSAARERYAVAQQAEREGLEELDAELAAVLAGLEAVQRTYRRALQLQGLVGRARAEMIQARVILGEIPAGMRATAPNRADVLADTYPVIRELVKWSR